MCDFTQLARFTNMNRLSRKKALLSILKKHKEEETKEHREENNETLKTNHEDIKKKLTQLREQSAKLKQDTNIQESDSESDEEIMAPKKSFSLYPKTLLQENEFMDDEQEEEEALENRVIVIRRLPHGFYEKELRQFFSQIAPITNARVVRNKKSGKSRGCAFVEFTDGEIAKMVAEEMDYYLLLDKVIRVEMCKIPLGEQKKLFDKKFEDLSKLEHLNWRAKNQYFSLAKYLQRKADHKDEGHINRIVKKKKSKILNRQKKWQEKGIQFEVPVSSK